MEDCRSPFQSWAPEVQVDSSGKWYGNALRFATQEEAEQNVAALADRWYSVINTRAVQSLDPVAHTYSREHGLGFINTKVEA